jgi:hypothetical protein
MGTHIGNQTKGNKNRGKRSTIQAKIFRRNCPEDYHQKKPTRASTSGDPDQGTSYTGTPDPMVVPCRLYPQGIPQGDPP